MCLWGGGWGYVVVCVVYIIVCVCVCGVYLCVMYVLVCVVLCICDTTWCMHLCLCWYSSPCSKTLSNTHTYHWCFLPPGTSSQPSTPTLLLSVPPAPTSTQPHSWCGVPCVDSRGGFYTVPLGYLLLFTVGKERGVCGCAPCGCQRGCACGYVCVDADVCRSKEENKGAGSFTQ